jgi:hypothetical protein
MNNLAKTKLSVFAVVTMLALGGCSEHPLDIDAESGARDSAPEPDSGACAGKGTQEPAA